MQTKPVRGGDPCTGFACSLTPEATRKGQPLGFSYLTKIFILQYIQLQVLHVLMVLTENLYLPLQDG